MPRQYRGARSKSVSTIKPFLSELTATLLACSSIPVIDAGFCATVPVCHKQTRELCYGGDFTRMGQGLDFWPGDYTHTAKPSTLHIHH